MVSNITQKLAARILVVEDDVHIGRLIGLTMPTLGLPYEFASVESATEALNLCRQAPCDLLLTDYHLPDMNGIHLIREMRKRGLYTPTILFTAYDVEAEARDLGVSAYMLKPFDIDELLNTIRTLLDGSSPSPQPISTLTATIYQS
jgi:two-component system, OmpR family, response regulator